MLRSYLRRLSLSETKGLSTALQPVASSRIGDKGLNIDEYLSMLIKQHYLERIEVPSAQALSATFEATQSGRRKQVRGSVRRNRQSGDTEVVKEFEWRWGARAEAEISERAVADFVTDIVMNVDLAVDRDFDEPDESEEEDVNQTQTQDATAEAGDIGNIRKRKKINLLKDIEKAAGSALIV
jgi:hypothetical protein